jgi:transposase-like protein
MAPGERVRGTIHVGAERRDTGAVARGASDDWMTNPDPEVPERARGPRRYSAKYKAQILDEYERLDKAAKGALLRREGLYTSLISEWRKQRDRVDTWFAPRITCLLGIHAPTRGASDNVVTIALLHWPGRTSRSASRKTGHGVGVINATDSLATGGSVCLYGTHDVGGRYSGLRLGS